MPSPLLPPEAIEAAARARWEREAEFIERSGAHPPGWEEFSEGVRSAKRSETEGDLSAALPALYEQQLDALMKLYRPNVPDGNFLGDASARGANDMLARVAVKLGLDDEEGMRERFRLADDEAYRRSERVLAALNAEDAATREGSSKDA